MEAAVKVIESILEEFVRQCGVMHDDDTGLWILKLPGKPRDKRTDTFTSGIFSICGGRQNAPYLTGSKHAGENLAEVLKQPEPGHVPQIHMCDARERRIRRPKRTAVD